jgi:purine-binding chemotaxis protein CheW
VPSAAKRIGQRRGETKNLVRFLVGDTCYGVDVGCIEEIVQPATVTALPHMAGGVAGVTDHRGNIVPIVDLRPRFSLPLLTPSRSTKWVLTRTTYGLVGFVVDRVLDVIGTQDAIAPAPHVGGEDGQRAIRGIVNIDGLLVFVLEIDRLAAIVADLEFRESEPDDGDPDGA